MSVFLLLTHYILHSLLSHHPLLSLHPLLSIHPLFSLLPPPSDGTVMNTKNQAIAWTQLNQRYHLLCIEVDCRSEKREERKVIFYVGTERQDTVIVGIPKSIRFCVCSLSSRFSLSTSLTLHLSFSLIFLFYLFVILSLFPFIILSFSLPLSSIPISQVSLASTKSQIKILCHKKLNETNSQPLISLKEEKKADWGNGSQAFQPEEIRAVLLSEEEVLHREKNLSALPLDYRPETRIMGDDCFSLP